MAKLESHNLKWKAHLQYFFAKFVQFKPIRTAFIQFGELAEYEHWKQQRFPSSLFPNRERLWLSFIEMFDESDLVVFEFGVAHGYATDWWLKNLRAKKVEWHGFDLFTGLPTTWARGGLDFYEAGAFDAQGRTPRIEDDRITWHIGNVTETLPAASDIGSQKPNLYLFDLDLGEPTSFCIKTLEHRIKKGDVFYFDEAFDPWNERKVITDQIFKFAKVEALGSTATALAFKVVEVN